MVLFSSKLGISEDEILFVFMFWCSHNVIYYIWAIPVAWAYKQNYMSYWKISKKYPNENLILKSSQIQIIMRLFVHPIVWLLIYRHIINVPLSNPLPDFKIGSIQIIISFYGFFMINAIAHKCMHIYPFIYQYHKDHHAFITTTGIAAEHHHLFDSIANAIPTFLPPIIIGMHPKLWCLYMFLRTWESVDSHNGYAFPFTPFRYLPGMAYQQEYHNFHHYANKGTYSCLCFDHFMGDDEPFLKLINKDFIGALTYGWLGGKHHW